ncbi:MAG: FKBP-type peptidyl-prolyl cis-trans isomerase [Candidatus Poribacteria bacterium]|nr:FKBP-type peptidyl-prolyl cis-trans isomerase [Candidatus Poribacteria bacterium]
MAAASNGGTVKIHYKGTLDDGSIFDSSDGRDPLEFTVGSGQVIPGFDAAVIGMSIGDVKTTTIAAVEAYGDRNDELVFDVPLEHVPEEMNPEVGQQLEVRTHDGQTAAVIVQEIGDESIKLDANHPLAGNDLTFELKLVGLV